MKNDKLNWYNSVLKGISDVAEKFIKAFKKNGWLFSFGTMMVFVLVYGGIVNPINVGKIVEQRFMDEREKVNRENELSMQKRLMADEIIGHIMTRLVDRFENVHRVLLLEGHNSISNRNGVHFSYFSCTAEMLTPNSRHFEYLSEDLQRQQRNTLIGFEMVNTLKNREYVYYQNIAECKHHQHRLIQKIAQSSDDTELIIYPFLNKYREPIILLVVSGQNLPVTEIIEYIHEHRTNIENCLS